MTIALLLAAGAAAALQAPFSYAKVEGFTKDGKTAVFDASIDAPSKEGEQVPWAEHVWVAIGDDGRPQHVAHNIESRADGLDESDVHLTPAARQLWDSAEDKAQGKLLEDAVKTGALRLDHSTGELKGGAAKARIEQTGSKACPSVRLYVSMGGTEAVVFEDSCPAPGKGVPAVGLTYTWNASKTALALAWVVGRGDNGGGHLAVLTARNLGAIDLLLAGGAAEPVLEKLAAAGFSVAHRGAAVKKRSGVAVYFAKGFEAEAAEIAQTLGLAAAAVQPVSWKTPYALTIALGGT